MSVEVKIKSSSDNQTLELTEEGFVPVVVSAHPLKTGDVVEIPFRQYMTDDGTSTGTLDMRVAASAASPQDFYIESDEDYDIYITSVSFEISDLNAALNKFGNITALTNGCKLCWEGSNIGSVVLHDALKSNYNFVRLCQGNPAFTGSGTTAFRASNVSGNSEGYIPVLNILDIFGMQHGLILRKGKKDRFLLRVQDNTSGVDSFNAIVYGKKIV